MIASFSSCRSTTAGYCLPTENWYYKKLVIAKLTTSKQFFFNSFSKDMYYLSICVPKILDFLKLYHQFTKTHRFPLI